MKTSCCRSRKTKNHVYGSPFLRPRAIVAKALLAAVCVPALSTVASADDTRASLESDYRSDGVLLRDVGDDGFGMAFRVLGEHDDNLLKLGEGQEESGYALRVDPVVRLDKEVGPLRILLEGALGARWADEADVEEFDADIMGGLDLNLGSGLTIQVRESYLREERDLSLWRRASFEPDETTTHQIDIGWAPGARTRANVGFTSQDTVYLDRDEERAESGVARIVLPVTQNVETYTDGELFDQDGAALRGVVTDFERTRVVQGLQCANPDGLTVWAGAGYEEIDFELDAFDDPDETVLEGGFELALSDANRLRMEAGRDVFGEGTLLAQLVSEPEAFQTELRAERQTKLETLRNRRLQGSADKRYYESTEGSLRVRRGLSSDSELSFGGSYEVQKSDPDASLVGATGEQEEDVTEVFVNIDVEGVLLLEASLRREERVAQDADFLTITATYQPVVGVVFAASFEEVDSDDVDVDGELWNGAVDLSRDIGSLLRRDRLARVGVMYRYEEGRLPTELGGDYEANRIGCYMTVEL